MSGVGGFRGVSADQDVRYINKEKKAMAAMNFPKELNQKVNVKYLRTKPGWNVIKEWIAKRITQLLGIEEEVLIGMVFNLLEEEKEGPIDPKSMHVTLTPFLEKNTSLFMKELWNMLASAHEDPADSGLPKILLDQQTAEIAARKKAEEEFNERVAKDRAAQQAAAEAAAAAVREHMRPPQPLASGRASRWDAGDAREAPVKREVKEEAPSRRDRNYEDRRDSHRDRDYRGSSRREDERSSRHRRSRSRERRSRSPGLRDRMRQQARRHRSPSRSVSRERVKRAPSASPSGSERSNDDRAPARAGKGKRSASGSDSEERTAKKSKKSKKSKKEKHSKKEKSSRKEKARHRSVSPGSGSGGSGSGDEELKALKQKAISVAKKAAA